MAEEYKSSKTRQVMNLINAKPSGVNPFLPPAEQEKEKKAKSESSVEDKLRTYTQSKRGANAPKQPTQVKHNPMLHIPDEEEQTMQNTQETVPAKPLRRHTGQQITIDINRIIIDEILDDALRRFNTCHCEKCKKIITEKVLEQVPVKIVTVTQDEEQSVVDSYCSYARKDIYSAIVKVVLANKRKPFHN
ncbi:MAG: hypothetical protein ACI4JV_10305 [Ruminiclostridium sp.]